MPDMCVCMCVSVLVCVCAWVCVSVCVCVCVCLCVWSRNCSLFLNDLAYTCIDRLHRISLTPRERHTCTIATQWLVSCRTSIPLWCWSLRISLPTWFGPSSTLLVSTGLCVKLDMFGVQGLSQWKAEEKIVFGTPIVTYSSSKVFLNGRLKKKLFLGLSLLHILVRRSFSMEGWRKSCFWDFHCDIF